GLGDEVAVQGLDPACVVPAQLALLAKLVGKAQAPIPLVLVLTAQGPGQALPVGPPFQAAAAAMAVQVDNTACAAVADKGQVLADLALAQPGGTLPVSFLPMGAAQAVAHA